MRKIPRKGNNSKPKLFFHYYLGIYVASMADRVANVCTIRCGMASKYCGFSESEHPYTRGAS